MATDLDEVQTALGALSETDLHALIAEKSIGPKSPAGKAKSARNAYKGATRAMLTALRRALREQDSARELIAE